MRVIFECEFLDVTSTYSIRSLKLSYFTLYRHMSYLLAPLINFVRRDEDGVGGGRGTPTSRDLEKRSKIPSVS